MILQKADRFKEPLSVILAVEPLVVLDVIVFLAMPVKAVVGGHVVAPLGVQQKSLRGSLSAHRDDFRSSQAHLPVLQGASQDLCR